MDVVMKQETPLSGIGRELALGHAVRLGVHLQQLPASPLSSLLFLSQLHPAGLRKNVDLVPC